MAVPVSTFDSGFPRRASPWGRSVRHHPVPDSAVTVELDAASGTGALDHAILDCLFCVAWVIVCSALQTPGAGQVDGDVPGW